MEGVQYRGDILSTVGDILSTVGVIMSTWGLSSTVGVFSTMGDTMGTVEGVQYHGRKSFVI